MIRFITAVVLFGAAVEPVSCLYSQTILSGAELESGCQVYADKAVKYAKEWEQLDCLKKLKVAPQLFTTDRNYHYLRCKNSVGTTIAADLQSMEKELAPCRSVTAGTGIATQPTGTGTTGGGTGTQPARPDPRFGTATGREDPLFGSRASTGDIWDILVINSADLAQSEHSFRIASLNGRFSAENLRSGGPAFNGQLNGSVLEATMTDRTGYQANFIGHRAAANRIEGTGCDNRGRSFSFAMTRR